MRWRFATTSRTSRCSSGEAGGYIGTRAHAALSSECGPVTADSTASLHAYLSKAESAGVQELKAAYNRFARVENDVDELVR